MVSHGDFSKGLVNSIQMLVGEQEDLVAYSLYPEQTVDSLREELEEEIKKTKEEEDILFPDRFISWKPIQRSSFLNERL